MKIGEIESQIRDLRVMCWCEGCLAIVIVIVIRETCDVVETGVSRGGAIDGWFGVHGSARVEAECAGRPPGDWPAEMWSLVRSS